jgi:hypothetical protein
MNTQSCTVSTGVNPLYLAALGLFGKDFPYPIEEMWTPIEGCGMYPIESSFNHR